MLAVPSVIADWLKLGSSRPIPVLMRVSIVSLKSGCKLPGVDPARATSSFIELLPTSMTATVVSIWEIEPEK